jgi:putative glutamine amidotransferase
VIGSRPIGPAPTIVVTVSSPGGAAPELTRQKTARYAERLREAGAAPVTIDETATAEEREKTFATMDGLLLSGGGDVHPSLYGQPISGSRDMRPERDALELAAWQAARQRHLPVLGICRGFQAINVFAGGALLQHVDGHAPPAERASEPRMHPLRLRPGSRLARIVKPSGAGRAVLQVNSWHHQAVRREDLAPGYIVAGTSPSAAGELVEAIESADPDQFVLGVQFHPERTESTPPEFARLWTVFVDACRGSATGTRVG